MVSTIEWARSFGISIEANTPSLELNELDEPYPHTAREIAIRAVVLQGVVAVACKVDPEPIIDWFQDEGIWENVSPKEKAFLLNKQPSADECNQLRWRQEAEWTLLWMIGTVEALGLPTRTCDTRRLVDEIIPALGSDISGFFASAQLRPLGLIHGEVERHYDLWCRAVIARRNKTLPEDLNFDVLYEREYAFEWANFTDEWNEVTCDS